MELKLTNQVTDHKIRMSYCLSECKVTDAHLILIKGFRNMHLIRNSTSLCLTHER
jgi:hypothetical protein